MIDDLLFRFRSLFRRSSVESDLEEELQFHREREIAKRMQAGATADEAERQTRLAFGGMDVVKEECRDARGLSTIDSLAQDLRYALRGLRRNLALATLGIGMLALGLGASTVVFSIFQTALLQPLPFRSPDSLVELWETRIARGIHRASFSEANFWDVRKQNRSFEEVGAYHYDEANLTGVGPAEKVSAIRVTASFFRTLGVSPLIGRDFLYEEGASGTGSPVAILGNAFWKARFGADRQILGKTIRLNDRAYTVIGVLPVGEPWINDQIYTPFGFRANADRGSWEFQVVGRLKSGVSPAQADADLSRVAATLNAAYPAEDKGIGFGHASSNVWIASANTRRALWVLLAAVTFLLLIACINMANLLLARGASRRREMAVRIALGAARMRLVRLVLIEAMLLSGAGAILGVGLAAFAIRAIQAAEISGIPRLTEVSLNPWVLGFAATLAIATGILSGLAAALRAPRTGVSGALRDGDHQTGSRSQTRLHGILVAGEVALSFLLLVGAGLLIRSFVQLMDVNRGFQTENRLVFSVSLPGSYYEHGIGKQFLDRFFEKVNALRDVIASGGVSNRPVEGGNPGMAIDAVSAAGRSPDQTAPWAGWRVISPGYLHAIGVPILRGRAFDERDKPVWAERGQPKPARRVIISERLAKLIFPKEDAIGKQVILWKGQSGGSAEVVGVAGDSRERGPADEPSLTVYLPYGRNALVSEFVVHTRGNPLALVPEIRSIVAGLDPNLPVADVRSFEEVVHRAVAPQRLNAILLSIFSGLALLLATTGIYGVLSYSITRRTSEIGLRVALGASSSRILGMAVSQGMRPALAGVAIGAAGAWWLSRYFGSLLFGVQPYDLLTYVSVALILLATALAACYLPGRRAMRIDPAVALRVE